MDISKFVKARRLRSNEIKKTFRGCPEDPYSRFVSAV